MNVLTAKDLAGRAGDVAHGFFGRRGGVSGGLYDSLNCGLGTNDDQEAVRENRRRVAASLQAASEKMVTLYQIHSAECVALDDAPAPGTERSRGDALVTDRPGLAIGVLTADCAPVLFRGADANGRPIIGAAHAGWKGALTGVIDSTTAAMRKLGALDDTLRAAVGPCIGRNSYEVSADFMAPFLDHDPASAAFFHPGAALDKRRFDLPGYVRSRLRAAGVADVSADIPDTYAAEADYFSYRRATHCKEPDYGRQIAVIVIS